MDIVTLNAKLRQGRGKGKARTLRASGRIPAELYGAGIGNLSLSVDGHDFELMLRDPQSSRGLINLTVEDAEEIKKTVMIKEIQRDPVIHNLIHVDFHEVRMDKKIMATVPVVTTGICKGEEEGGLLQIIRRDLEIECLPMDIPEKIEIDITNLDIGESIHIEDIALSGNIEIPHDSNFTIVTVVSPRKEEEEEVAEEELEEGEEAEAAEESSEENSEQ